MSPTPITNAPLRPVEFWQAQVVTECRDDGSIIVRQHGPLPDWPERLSDRIAHWADRTPGQTWMAERGADGQWVRVSYGELLQAIRSIGQALLDLGLSVERPLLIVSENAIAHALVALGAQYVGIPSAAIAPAYAASNASAGRLAAIVEQITPGAVFAADLDPCRTALDAVLGRIPRLGVRGTGLTLEWQTLLDTRALDAVDAANRATGPDTVAKFMFTSGTTGSPKAVIQTQRMLCSNMAMVTDCFAWFAHEPPVVLDWAPWHHVASGNKVFNMVLYNGGTYHIDAGKPAPGLFDTTLANLREVSPTWYFNVPLGFEMLVEAMRKDHSLATCFFRDLKMLMYAGAAMSESTWAALDRLAIETTGERVFLTTGLGATETAPFALFCTDPQQHPGNVGIPAKGLSLKLVPVDGRWEARVKGPSVTPGYWRNEALTRAAFDDEGYYMLGDALRFADPDDAARGFYFDGRTAENFKLATGTWVGVGALRAKLVDALGGLARDAVIAGEGRAELGALLVPFRPAIERIVPDALALSDNDLFAHPTLRAAIAQRLAAFNATVGGSSQRVQRALIITGPLDIDKGEVTDKGSVNQRVVIRERSALVEALFSNDSRTIFAR